MSLYFFLAVLATCCAYALARGGAPERIAAGLQLGAWPTDELIHRAIVGRAYASVATGSALVDLILLLALIVLAWRSTRYWPLWVAACQLAAVVAHIAKLIDPEMRATGYAIQSQFWAYPMLIVMALGAWRFRERWNAGIREPDWKRSLA